MVRVSFGFLEVREKSRAKAGPRSNEKTMGAEGGRGKGNMIFSTKFVGINRGVLQSTVLGSVLFSVMVNDIMAVHPNKNLPSRELC